MNSALFIARTRTRKKKKGEVTIYNEISGNTNEHFHNNHKKSSLSRAKNVLGQSTDLSAFSSPSECVELYPDTQRDISEAHSRGKHRNGTLLLNHIKHWDLMIVLYDD